MRRRRNPTETVWWVLGLAGAAAAVGGVLYATTSSAAAKPAPIAPPGPTTIPAGQGFAVGSLQPGDNGTATISAQGGMLTVSLPAGASIAANGVSVAIATSAITARAGYAIFNSDGSSSAVPVDTSAFTLGQNTLTIVWTDPSSQQQQTSTVTVQVVM